MRGTVNLGDFGDHAQFLVNVKPDDGNSLVHQCVLRDLAPLCYLVEIVYHIGRDMQSSTLFCGVKRL
jgi:hypothetical protein